MARPLFTQDATRGPRSCRGAGALPTPRRWGGRWGGGEDGTRGPSPCAAARPPRGRILLRGSPRPAPALHPGPRRRWRQRPGWGPGRGVLGAAGPLERVGGGTGRGGRVPGRRREEARPAALPRPGPVACHWSARSAPSLCPRRPSPSADSGGGNGVAPLPASLQLFFFFLFPFPLGGGVGGVEEREGEADLQTPRLPQPSSESIVTRGPAAPSGPPLFKSFAPGGPARAAGSPRAPPGRLLSASVASPVLVTFSLSPRRRKLRPPLGCVRLGTSSLREALAAEFQNNCSGRRKLKRN